MHDYLGDATRTSTSALSPKIATSSSTPPTSEKKQKFESLVDSLSEDSEPEYEAGTAASDCGKTNSNWDESDGSA